MGGGIGDEDTLPGRPGARRDPDAPSSLPEVGRALKYVYRDLGLALAILTGDPNDPRDMGLRGDVQEQGKAIKAIGEDVATLKAQRVMPWWLTTLLAVASLVHIVRLGDALGRDWGLWSVETAQVARAQALP